MAKLPDQASEDDQTRLFRVRPTRQAWREGRVGDLFEREDERLWVLRQLRLLRHWPMDAVKQEQFGSDLDFEKVDHAGQTFYELRLSDPRLSHNRNLRAFFWIHDETRTVWILHGFWKKTRRIDESVKALVARRLRDLKGHIHDGRA